MSSSWNARLRSHAIWPIVDAIRSAIAIDRMPADSDLADAVSRLQWLVEVLAEHHDVEDARPYSVGMLDRVQSGLTNIQTNLAQYETDPETYRSSLQVAADQVDLVLDGMNGWPQLTARAAAISAGIAASNYEKASKAALADLESRVSGLSEASDSLKTDFATFLETQRAEDEESFESFINSEKTKLSELAEQLAGDAAVGREKKDQLDSMEQQGRKVLEAVATRAVARDYAENARNKAVAGWIWDVLGLLVGALSVGFLLYHLFANDAPTGSVPLALTRLAVSIGGVGIAALCFHRGSGNHAESRRSKRAHIRLSTAGPFMVDQDPVFRDAVLQGMADRIYLQGILDDEGGGRFDASLLDTLIARVKRRGVGEGEETHSGS